MLAKADGIEFKMSVIIIYCSCKKIKIPDSTLNNTKPYNKKVSTDSKEEEEAAIILYIMYIRICFLIFLGCTSIQLCFIELK